MPFRRGGVHTIRLRFLLEHFAAIAKACAWDYAGKLCIDVLDVQLAGSFAQSVLQIQAANLFKGESKVNL